MDWLSNVADIVKSAFDRTPTITAVPHSQSLKISCTDHTPPPGVLPISTRSAPRKTNFISDGIKPLAESMKTVGTVVERAYNGNSLASPGCANTHLNLKKQTAPMIRQPSDGPAAGQSILHVNLHIFALRIPGRPLPVQWRCRMKPVANPLKMDADAERELVD